MANRYVVVDKATNQIVGGSPIIEAAISQRVIYKDAMRGAVESYTLYDNDPDVEIRIYEEP